MGWREQVHLRELLVSIIDENELKNAIEIAIRYDINQLIDAWFQFFPITASAQAQNLSFPIQATQAWL